MKRIAKILILSLVCVCCAVGFAACDNGDKTVDTRDERIVSVYNTYVAYAEENGITPKTYEEWLALIKGEKGDKGEDGITPTIEISADGFWIINGEKTEYKAIGKDGKDGINGSNADGSVSINISEDGFWIINGTKTEYRAIGRDGQDGTNGIDGTNGVDGVGIKSIEKTSSDGLVDTYTITYSNDSVYIFTIINGADGKDGVDGINGTNGTNGIDGVNGVDGQDGKDGTTPLLRINEETNYWEISYDNGISYQSLGVKATGENGADGVNGTNGTNGIDGQNGKDGIDGLNGKDGIGVKSVIIDDNGNLILTMTDNSTINAGKVKDVHPHTIVEKEIIDKMPTCTGCGIKYLVCGICGEPIKTIITEALGHNYINNVCTVCGEQQPTDSSYFTFKLLSNDTYDIKVNDKNNLPNEVVLPTLYNGKAVTSIGEGAFSWCSELTSVTIPNSVTSIGGGAFSWCSSLMSLNIPDSVTSIGKALLIDTRSLTTETVLYSITSINVDGKNDYYKSIDGNLYSKDGTTLIQYALGKTDTEFTINDNVTGLGDYAFSYCSNLTSVMIPDSVTNLGGMSGGYVFYHCNNLLEINVSNEHEYLTSIDGDLYNKKGTILKRFATGKSVANITESTTVIDWYAFNGCNNLTDIIIPNSVTSFGVAAFSDCISLTNITFKGTKAQWQAINKGSFWHNRVPSSCIIHCTNGNIKITEA